MPPPPSAFLTSTSRAHEPPEDDWESAWERPAERSNAQLWAEANAPAAPRYMLETNTAARSALMGEATRNIKILKRESPTPSSARSSDSESSSKKDALSLKDREKAYEEARRRIMGEDKQSSTSIKVDGKAPVRTASPKTETETVRSPKGPGEGGRGGFGSRGRGR